ncbi:hypothetical protein EN873_08830 [bacterium M00.F.Ca.ET.230.01.1.1]|nr:hypothetical protein EN873_08830 [bacterium M00.F.Ca.ET.230.01.1.1]
MAKNVRPFADFVSCTMTEEACGRLAGKGRRNADVWIGYLLRTTGGVPQSDVSDVAFKAGSGWSYSDTRGQKAVIPLRSRHRETTPGTVAVAPQELARKGASAIAQNVDRYMSVSLPRLL